MVKYYKKFNPAQALFLSSGRSVSFQPIDKQTGVLATTNEQVQQEIEQAIAQERGGVSVITADEYDELQKKKQPNPLQPSWREEYDSQRFLERPVPQPRPTGRPAVEAKPIPEPGKNGAGPDEFTKPVAS